MTESIGRKYYHYLLVLFALSVATLDVAHAQQDLPVIKVDLNMNGRPRQEVEYDYPNPTHSHWTVTKPLADTVTFNGITFILKKGPRGNALASTYYKASVQMGLFDSRFTNDGVFVKDGNFAEGASIDLIIKGLPIGKHSLQTFHNMTDNLTPDRVTPMDVYVNGVREVEALVPTVRLERITEIASANLTLDVVDTDDIVISFRAVETGSQPIKNVMINGFYLNAGDAANLARAADPLNGDEHLDVPIGGGYTLKWEGAASAQSHDVYFGTDSVAVFSADRNSSLYKGNKAKLDTVYAVSDLHTMDTYYWRVDEVMQGNEIHKGEVWRFRTAQLAFEGAEGFGKLARGGRGGRVVYVDNLNDSGPGSLREAVTNSIGPRTIVFNVGGVIELKSRLVLSDRYVTIAGQTAPGKGILIKSSPFGIGANDAIVRFIRLRLGGGPTADGMGMNGNHSIMDHCSISWTIDEAFSSRGAKNITLQRTLISEALNAAGHKNYPPGTEHGYAATVGGDKGSLHHNLLAHCYGRNWSLGGGLDGNNYLAGKMDIRNNVVYNWGGRTTDGGAHEVNFVNNYYKPGPGTRLLPFIFTLDHENIGLGTQRCYFNGNVVPGHFDESSQETGRRAVYRNGAVKTYETFVDQPFFDAPVTTQAAKHAYKMVLSDVGASQPYFDTHDQRMIQETLAGTSTVVGSVTGKLGFPDDEKDSGGYEDYPSVVREQDWDSDRDGLPDWWEEIHGLNVNSAAGDFSDANADHDRDGFTNLDEYLQWMALPHYSSANGMVVKVDLKALSMGFSDGPIYTVSKAVNGTVLAREGFAEFTPDAAGLCSFEFTVKDSEGHSMTRQVNIVNGVKMDDRKQDQEISFPEIVETTYDKQQIELAANASSGLAVTYSSANPDIVAVEGNILKFTGVGSAQITASQEGNDDWNAAEPVVRTVVVNKGLQTITFAALPSFTIGDDPLALEASSSSSLPLSFKVDNLVYATVDNTEVVGHQEGRVTITAQQSGNELWQAATEVSQELEIIARPKMDVVKIISPNGDGQNDILVISEIERYTENTVRIFNRQGRMLYEVQNYNNVDRAFDGKDPNGRLLDDGTYFFKLEWKQDGKTQNQSGWFYLKK